MGLEDWILSRILCTFSYKIDNKYQKAKIKNLEQRLDSQKYNIKQIKQNHKNYKKYVYMKFALKIGSFFGKVRVGYKNEN